MNVGDKVKFTAPVDRFPWFLIEAGATGEVTYKDDMFLTVKMDPPFDDAGEMWGDLVEFRLDDEHERHDANTLKVIA